MKEAKNVRVRLTEEELVFLKKEAIDQKKSMSEFMRDLLVRYQKRVEKRQMKYF